MPFPLLIFGILAVAAVAFSKTATAGSIEGDAVHFDNPWGLPDIDASQQQGNFDTTYDESYERAHNQSGVPFALIKAHAIRESAQVPNAYHYDNPKSGASFGLLQVEYVYGNRRFEKYGVFDDEIGTNGNGLYDPDLSSLLGAFIIRDNLNWLKGNLRDTINAYNTGTTEGKHPAPNNYVNDVLTNYSEIVGRSVN